MATKRRLTAEQFEAVRPLLGISAKQQAAARAAMVEGRTLQAIATENGWKARQSVADAVAVVWQTFEKFSAAAQALDAPRKGGNVKANSKQLVGGKL